MDPQQPVDFVLLLGTTNNKSPHIANAEEIIHLQTPSIEAVLR